VNIHMLNSMNSLAAGLKKMGHWEIVSGDEG
jgi:hypothetical protein